MLQSLPIGSRITKRINSLHARVTRSEIALHRPPGPVGLPLIGSMKGLATAPHQYVTQLQADYGDMVHFWVGPQSMYLITDPTLIEQVLLKKSKSFVKDPITRHLSVALGDGLLVSEHGKWRRQRRLIAPAFKKTHIAGYAEAMVDRALEMRESVLQGDEPREIHHDLMKATMYIVSDTLFGAEVEADAKMVGHTLETMMTEFVRHVRTWRRFLPDWVPTKGAARVQKSLETIDSIMFGLIASRRESGELGDDMLSLLLAARDEDGFMMDDQQIRDEALTMFVAGHETTALALSYAIRAVATHPEVEATLIAELDSVLGDRRATVADVRSLPYTDAIIKETMRLWPPAWMIAREATEDVTIGDYVIPESSQVLMPQWVVHRDPKWFDDADAFRPDRWVDGSTDEMPRYAYFPFGGGPRTCIGNHFASMESILVLATLYQGARFEALDPVLETQPSVTMRPTRGMTMRAHVREAHSAD